MGSTAAPLSDDLQDEASLYALLNVRRDASDEEIRRAYRQLASTLHPDKAPDPALHSAAAREFSRVQEAYEVLSDPSKRDIYDVYGSEGLSAGMELSGPYKSRDEMRKEWEAFREKRRRENEEATFAHRGTYVFRTDATALVSPYAPHLPRTPHLTNVFMTSGVDIPITSSKHWGAFGSEQDVLHIGGLVSVRDNVGGGSFMAGYRRVYSDYTTVGFEASAGLRSLVSATTSFQLSQHSSASLTASWSPKSGAGLQVSTTRQLSDTTSGEFSWTVGPQEARGMALSVTHRHEKTALMARVEVGAATALVVRVMRQITDVFTGRISIKLGTIGVEADVGGTRRLSESSTAGLSVVAGMQGVLLRVRYTRAGHVFEFPILLAPTLDYRVLIGTYIITPLAVYVAKDLVAGPLGRAIEARRTLSERRQAATEISEALAHAEQAEAVMAPVARRKARKEAAAGGLVVALALYGEEGAVKDSALERLSTAAAQVTLKDTQESENIETQEIAPELIPEAVGETTGSVEDVGVSNNGVPAVSSDTLPNAATTATTATTSAAAAGGSTSAAPPKVEEVVLPPAVADVTVAVQYLTEGSKVVLHQGYSKASLMGFCDPSPRASKLLLVYFMYQGRPYKAMVSDTEGAQLPGRGTLVDDPEEALLVETASKRLL